MRKLKRLLAAVMIIALAFSLAACGKSDIVGTWYEEYDLKDIIVAGVDSALGDSPISFGDYIDSCNVGITAEFKEDGTYRQTIDEEIFYASMEDLKVAMEAFYSDYFMLALAEMLQQMGVTEDLSTKEALEVYLGMSFEEAIEQSLGMDMTSYVETIAEGFTIENVLGESKSKEGNYKTDGDKLHMSDGLEHAIDPAVYEIYSIEGDILTITEGSSDSGVSEMPEYPYSMKRVA